MKNLNFLHGIFHPEKSPRTLINPLTKVYDCYPKHEAEKHRGVTVWDSSEKGTYIRAKHGELQFSKRKAIS